MQRGPDCLSGSQTTAGLVSLDAFARSKDATPSPPRSSHFHPWWCTPRVLLGCLEMRDQILRGLRGRPVEIEGTDKPSILVHKVNEGRVLQGVPAILERVFSGVSAVSFHSRVDCGAVAGQAHDALVEAAQIALQGLRRVAFGIDRNEQRPQITAFVAGRPQDFRNLEQLGRTDVRAMRETEKNEMRLAQEVAVGHGAAVLIDKREGAPDGGRRPLMRRWRQSKNSSAAERSEAEKEDEKRQDKPPAERGHVLNLNRFKSTRRAPREPCR